MQHHHGQDASKRTSGLGETDAPKGHLAGENHCLIESMDSTGVRAGWTCCVVLLLALVSTRTSAAEPAGAGASEDIFFQDVPVILSATRLSQPVSESPAAITVIDRELIEASGAIDIPDLFKMVPGFQVGHANGRTAVVTYHGLTDSYARRMQVLVDGRSVYTPLFGGVQWQDLPLAIEDIERIEVIRGPNGVTYGANAFYGVINIVTRDPSLDRGLQASITHGDLGTRKTFARYGGETGKLIYRLSAGQQQDEGITTSTPDNKRSTLLTFRGDYRANARDSFDIQFGYNTGPRGKGDPTSLTSPPREENVSSGFQQLRWKRVLGSDEEINLQFYHNTHRATDTYNAAPLSQILSAGTMTALAALGYPDQRINVVEDTTSERFDLELFHTFRPWRDLRLVWGGELRLDRVSGKGWFGTTDYVSNRLHRVFANAEWRFMPDTILNAGVLYEHNSISGSETSPRLAINHHLTQHHTLRAGVTRAYRTPSLYEHRADTAFRFPDGVALDRTTKSNRPLVPERVTTYELGYAGEFPAHSALLDVRLYRDTIRDIITATSLDPTVSDLLSNSGTSFRNDGYAEVSGADIQLAWRPTPRTRLLLGYAHASQQGQTLTRLTPVTQSETHHSTPTETTNLMVLHRFPRGFEASASYRIVTDMEFLGGGTERTGTYTTGDLRLAWKFRAADIRGQMAMTVQNFTGGYFDFDDGAPLDTRYLYTLSLEFR